jgi:hypothetical protein
MPIRVSVNPSRLTWSHFRTVSSIPNSSEEAQVNPEMMPIENVRPQSVGERFRLPSLTLSVKINAHNTLVLKTAHKTKELLQHEQGHLDLLVLVTRALARDLENLEADSVNELATLLEEAKSLHDERAQAIDAAYDDQTEHSRNSLKQAAWDRAIAQALNDPRASKVVDLPL